MTNIQHSIIIASLVLLSACSSLPSDFARSKTYASAENASLLGEKAAALLGDTPHISQMYLLNEGTDAFFARMFLLRSATRTIDVQYFIFSTDK